MTNKIKLSLTIISEVANLNRIEQKRLDTDKLEKVYDLIKYNRELNCYIFDGVLSLGEPNNYTKDQINAVAYFVLRSGLFTID